MIYPQWLTNVVIWTIGVISTAIIGGILWVIGKALVAYMRKPLEDIKERLDTMEEEHTTEWAKQDNLRKKTGRNTLMVGAKIDALRYSMNGAIDKNKYNQSYEEQMSDYEREYPELFEK